MNERIFDEPAGATPLTEEDKEGLIPAYISTRAELNQAEQRNILQAELWAFRKRRNPLDTDFLRDLHRRMFDQVWKWAGAFRRTERSIGIDPSQIQIQLKQLVGDVQYQVDHQVYDPDEIAARFHHRLVFMHPFPNGNGRLSRMATDILLSFLGRERFTWGAWDLENKGNVRTRYVTALRSADRGEYGPLIEFVRSGNGSN
jgi:Fic-DOC domain mobile mystery protein B